MNENHKFGHLHLGLPDDILRYKVNGDFDRGIKQIEYRVSQGDLSEEMVDALRAQSEIMRRLPEEYPFSQEEAMGLLQKHIPDFTLEELQEKVLKGKIDWIYIKGQPHYFGRFFESLYKTDSDFQSRVITEDFPRGGIDPNQNGEHIFSDIKKEMMAKGELSKRIRIRSSLRVKDEFLKKGEGVRVHLPIPRACDQQSDIRIETVYPANAVIAPEDAAQRTIYWEETMKENHEFLVEYSYIHTAKYTEISSVKPDPDQGKHDLEEKAPHIMFTPYLMNLGERITKGLDSPLDKAKAIYDFITNEISYAFMPSYFCMENIAEACALNRRGDCGVMTLLFITLCRSQGIPAQWQSGLIARRDFCGAHDWARFHIKPYGWMVADPSFGVDAKSRGDEEKRAFYFGNLDPFRMVANNEFQADFIPSKNYWRCDPYDNQVGEIETEKRPLLYSMFLRNKQVMSVEDL